MDVWSLADSSQQVAVAAGWGLCPRVPGPNLEPIAALGITRVHLVGDVDFRDRYLDRLNRAADWFGMKVMVTPGLSAVWPSQLPGRSTWETGRSVLLRPAVAWLVQGHRWSHGGCEFLSVGSVSADLAFTPQPADPSDPFRRSEVSALLAGGHADVILALGPPAALLKGLSDESGQGELQTDGLTRLWNELDPDLLIHGHHEPARVRPFPFEQKVISLATEGAPGNVTIIDLPTLTAQWIEDARA